ncbi:MAG: hypothetical protein AAF548_11990 [Actinomycetota bacterium]
MRRPNRTVRFGWHALQLEVCAALLAIFSASFGVAALFLDDERGWLIPSALFGVIAAVGVAHALRSSRVEITAEDTLVVVRHGRVEVDVPIPGLHVAVAARPRPFPRAAEIRRESDDVRVRLPWCHQGSFRSSTRAERFVEDMDRAGARVTRPS